MTIPENIFAEGEITVVQPIEGMKVPEKQKLKCQKGNPVFLNIVYLIDAIRNLESSTVTIQYLHENGEANKPTLIKGDGYKAVVMPMRGQ